MLGCPAISRKRANSSTTMVIGQFYTKLAALFGLKLLAAQPLLAVFLGNRDLVRVKGSTRDAPMLGGAAVANDHVADDVIDESINRGGTEQNRPGDGVLVADGEQIKQDARGRQQAHAEPLGKILHAVQLLVAAGG